MLGGHPFFDALIDVSQRGRHDVELRALSGEFLLAPRVVLAPFLQTVRICERKITVVGILCCHLSAPFSAAFSSAIAGQCGPGANHDGAGAESARSARLVAGP